MAIIFGKCTTFVQNSNMNIQTFTAKLNSLFNIQQAEDFDNVGLLCGNPEREVSRVLVCHDALEEVIEEAIEKNCQLVVCFHPIIFKGLKKITGKNYVEKAILKAIENKIAIYAIHTALDNDFWGVNEMICQKLGITQSHILMPKPSSLMQLTFYVPTSHAEVVKQALFHTGAGHIGNYDQCSFSTKGIGSFRPLLNANPFLGQHHIQEHTEEEMVSLVFNSHQKSSVISALKRAHPYEEVAFHIVALENANPYIGLGKYGNLPEEMTIEDFLSQVKEKFSLSVIKHSHHHGKIRKVAVLGGSGAEGIEAAILQKCDAYLTADLKYHDYFRAEKKLLLCDIGHFESERFVVSQIITRLSENFSTFAFLKSEVNTNPVNYF